MDDARDLRAFCSAISCVTNGPSVAKTLLPLEEVTSTYQPRVSIGTDPSIVVPARC